jgi:secreted trypsin-like serine protease
MKSVWTLAALSLVAACGGPSSSQPSATSSQAVIGGSADSAHASVVSIVAQVDAASPELCTGTVIAPRVVLTAGHCTIGQDPAGLVVGVGPSAGSPTTQLSVAAVFTYPGYGGTDDLPLGTDLGAVILAEDSGLPSVPLWTGDAANLVGSAVTLVGYGQSSASDLESSGTRREVSLDVRSACSALLSFGDATTNACHGDSGAPLFVSGDGGVQSLVAVVSYGDPIACATPTHAVRLDRYASWIASVLAGTASADGGTCTQCPPPATDCEGNDAGADDASGTGTDAAAAAEAGATHPGSSGGGCALASRRDEAPSPVAVLCVTLLLARRARRARCARLDYAVPP